MILTYKSRHSEICIIDTEGYRLIKKTASGQMHLEPHGGGTPLTLTESEFNTIEECTSISKSLGLGKSKPREVAKVE